MRGWQFGSVGDGVKPSLGEGAAPPKPLQRENHSLPRAMARNGFLRVIRTRRIEFARSTQEGREEYLIDADEEEQNPRADAAGLPCYLPCFSGIAARGISFSNCSLNSENFAFAAELRG